MTSRYMWYLREILKKVWVRVVSFALLALFSVYLARVISPYLPESYAPLAGAESVADLLGILTSSMLAVTTFSLSIAVSAFTAATVSATPRATILLQEDRTTQNVLATFLGAFLFGLVGLIALHAKLYTASGKVVVFFFTIAVIGLVVVALIRWIEHLMQFGRMSDTLDRVEKVATEALAERLKNPYLGGQPLIDTVPHEYVGIPATKTGYVQHIDMQALQSCADETATQIYVRCLPGSFVCCGEVILSVEAPSVVDKKRDVIRRAVTIGSRNTFENNPRFCLIVLSEIASKALSPAVNDPGTVIDIIGRLTRILSHWRERADADVKFPRLFVRPISARGAIEDTFRPIARDGISLVEVQIRLHEALASLSQIAPESFALAAGDIAHEALERAEASPLLATEMAAIQSAAESKKQTMSKGHAHA